MSDKWEPKISQSYNGEIYIFPCKGSGKDEIHHWGIVVQYGIFDKLIGRKFDDKMKKAFDEVKNTCNYLNWKDEKDEQCWDHASRVFEELKTNE